MNHRKEDLAVAARRGAPVLQVDLCGVSLYKTIMSPRTRMNLPSDVIPTKTLGVERRRGVVVHSSMDSSLIWMTDVKLEYRMTMDSSNAPGGQSSGDRLSFLFKAHVFSGIHAAEPL